MLSALFCLGSYKNDLGINLVLVNYSIQALPIFGSRLIHRWSLFCFIFSYVFFLTYFKQWTCFSFVCLIFESSGYSSSADLSAELYTLISSCLLVIFI